jgi:hypothetical protein
LVLDVADDVTLCLIKATAKRPTSLLIFWIDLLNSFCLQTKKKEFLDETNFREENGSSDSTYFLKSARAMSMLAFFGFGVLGHGPTGTLLTASASELLRSICRQASGLRKSKTIVTRTSSFAFLWLWIGR